MANASMQSFMAAQYAGQQLNTELDNRKADVQMKQQQIAQSQQTMAMQQQQQAQQKQAQEQMSKMISDFDQHNAAKQVEEGTSPDDAKLKSMEETASLYEKMGKSQLATNPTLAEGLIKLADSTRGRRSQLEKDNLGISEKKAKDTASYAGSVLEGLVSPEDAFAWTAKNVSLKEAMGIPKDPIAMKAYWKGKQLQGQSASEQVAAIRQEKNDEDRAEEKKTAREDKLQFHKDSQTNIALQREMMRDAQKSRKEELALRHEERAAAAEKKGTGGASGAGGNIQFRNTLAAVNYANEAVRGLDLVMEMGAGVTSGVFGHLAQGEGIPSALAKNFGNKMTAQDQQVYQTATKGLGLELAQLATAGSGRGANQAVTKELQSMVEVIPGDTKGTAMYKLANAADFVRKRLEAVPDSSDPRVQKTREKADKALERYPTPSQVLKALEAAGQKIPGRTPAQKMAMQTALSKAAEEAAAADAKKAGSEHPEDIQSLLDKYAPKK